MLTLRKLAHTADVKVLTKAGIKIIKVAKIDKELFKFDPVANIFIKITNNKLIDYINQNPFHFDDEVTESVLIQKYSNAGLMGLKGKFVCNISNHSFLLDSPAFCEFFLTTYQLNGTISQDPVDLMHDLIENRNMPDELLEVVDKIQNNNLIRKDGILAIATLLGFGSRHVPASLQSKMVEKILEEYPDKIERTIMFIGLALMNNDMYADRLMVVQGMVNANKYNDEDE